MSTSTTDPTLSVNVRLSPDLARTIDILARERGQDRASFIASFLQEQLDGPVPTFEELVAPVHEDFREGGMTEEELDEFLEQEIRDARAERKAR
jgi:predicted transcriptional regulator